MPSLSGQHIPVLRVSDVQRSATWYVRVFGLQEDSRFMAPDGVLRQVVLVDPASELSLCLAGPGDGSRFNELAAGLDHLELVVPCRPERDRWVEELDRLKVPHSGIKQPNYSQAAMVTLRDPDNIQLELFCPQR